MRGFGFGPGRNARRRPGPADTPAAPVTLAVLAGQSNMEGRDVRTAATDTDIGRVVQYRGEPGQPGYRTLSADITPLSHYATYLDNNGAGIPNGDVLGPGEYIARELVADDPMADVVLVPVARGSTRLLAAPAEWLSSVTAGGGGYLFENMITQANLAYAAAQSAYPGRPIRVVLFWSQGEFDATGGTTRQAYAAALADLVTRFRARVTGAAAAPVVIGSMIPERWQVASPFYEASYGAINAAQVDVSRTLTGVRYAMGPVYAGGNRDYLHYQPAQRIRDYGLAMGAALADVAGPSVMTGATQGSSQGSTLAVPLTADDGHATFELHGGADAALFEVSDPYLSPTLRWVGNGTGPAAGAYAVVVRARDGAGNYGPDRTITVEVAAPYGVGDQGPVTATWLGAYSRSGNAYSPVTYTGVKVRKGLNLWLVRRNGTPFDYATVTIANVPATKFLSDGGNLQVWGAVVGADDDNASVVYTWDSGAQGPADAEVNCMVAMTGTKATPLATDAVGWNYRGSPVGNAAALPYPTGGMVVGLACTGSTPTPANGSTLLGLTDFGGGFSVFALTKQASGWIGANYAGGYSALASLVFEKSGT